MNVLERIVKLDLRLFHEINGVWINHFFDNFFPYLRESILWIPLYLFLLLFACINFGIRGLYWCVAILCMAAMGDIISSRLVKESIFRLRPCRTPSLVDAVRLMVVYCPQSSSFVSSHATNHFGAAMFIFVTWRKQFSKWILLFFLWAGAISYAQIYVGVHFPLDVLGGTLLGCGIGAVSGQLYNRYIGISAPVSLNQ